MWAVENDLGQIVWYSIGAFIEDTEGVYRSQEDFENAVMAVVMKRLSIHSHEAYIQVGDFGSAPECSL